MSEGATKVQEGMEVQEGMGNNMIDIINEMNNEFGREDEMKLEVRMKAIGEKIRFYDYSIVDDSTVDDSIVDSIEDSIVKNAIRQKCELLIIIQFTFYDILLEK